MSSTKVHLFQKVTMPKECLLFDSRKEWPHLLVLESSLFVLNVPVLVDNLVLKAATQIHPSQVCQAVSISKRCEKAKSAIEKTLDNLSLRNSLHYSY
jgi:hypothetical protein